MLLTGTSLYTCFPFTRKSLLAEIEPCVVHQRAFNFSRTQTQPKGELNHGLLSFCCGRETSRDFIKSPLIYIGYSSYFC